MRRLSIDAWQVAIILDRKSSTAQKLLRTIKDAYSKEQHQKVSIREFCEYVGLPYDEVYDLVNGRSADSKKAS